MAKLTIPEPELMECGHMGCLGCGATMVMRYVLKALGPKTILSIPACCWAVMPGVFPYTNMKVPMLYTAFEVTGASISGLRAGLDILGKEDINVVGFAGDGGTVDIGLQALSGAVERGHNVFYIMYDNEAYMNTGIQRSGSTPHGAWTTTTPVGVTKDWKKEEKKQIVDIMVAHKIPYTATASVAYPEDFIKKLQKAREIKGPKFFHVYAPCPTGWKTGPDASIELARLAIDTKIFPMYEVVNGVYKITKKIKEPKPVGDYLLVQGRYSHMKKNPDLVVQIQKEIDQRYKEIELKEKYTQELYGPPAETKPEPRKEEKAK